MKVFYIKIPLNKKFILCHYKFKYLYKCKSKYITYMYVHTTFQKHYSLNFKIILHSFDE